MIRYKVGSPVAYAAVADAAAAAKSFIVEYCGCTATITQEVGDAESEYVSSGPSTGKGGGCSGKSYKAGKAGKVSLQPSASASSAYQSSSVGVATGGAVVAVVAVILVAIRHRRVASDTRAVDMKFVDDSESASNCVHSSPL